MIFNTVYKKSGGIELSRIAVKTPPTRTAYEANETIDVSGMTLEATYSNGATRELTTGFTYSPTVAAKGDTAITISFTEFGITATTTQAISVGSIKATFSDNSWAEIIMACQTNSVPDTWAVGDQKSMDIGGMSYKIDIIGKNHDSYADGSGTAPLTLQMHDCYAISSKMRDTGSNAGGWENTYIRDTLMAEILNKFPDEVKAAVREVSKLTGAGSASTTLVTTADKLFIPSETELFGSANIGAPGEGTQYPYYETSANRKKYRGTTGVAWWTRTPSATSTTTYVYLYASGAQAASIPTTARYVSAAWCF